jgi:hypothetical protein
VASIGAVPFGNFCAVAPFNSELSRASVFMATFLFDPAFVSCLGLEVRFFLSFLVELARGEAAMPSFFFRDPMDLFFKGRLALCFTGRMMKVFF